MQQILIADDDRLSAEVLARTLTPDKFEVTVASDGAEAKCHLCARNTAVTYGSGRTFARSDHVARVIPRFEVQSGP